MHENDGPVTPAGGDDASSGAAPDGGAGPDSTATDDAGLLALLRAAPVLAGPLPEFDPDGAPDTPGPLLAAWLRQALADGVPEPHVMTLATAAADGTPSARVLMLRGIDTAACAVDFASDAASRKGRDLAENPRAALTWYWPAQGRQIRLSGRVHVLDTETARRDFLGRSPASRAAGFTGSMSGTLTGAMAYERARAEAEALVAAEPGRVPDGHTVYRLRAQEAEFFQADPGRFHVRLRYAREDEAAGAREREGGRDDAGGPGAAGWTRTLLWP
ncbi:pyridoxamine 5'-phosphate oxidase [Actinacidiphila alni]|uniref:Pyridoxamine 5'-phosphate oxidase n=1 Tax=Actinacidiphila alni TaxID=380248 RepID=A0A1I2KH47_9ACTN|nr:pyridoxamine 5'-phosphate oxidase family protein [Actinacidiphila alni]SFF65609.1 pyridoxamine 5'-phosphate oxidase [Actinacidiphila alni]